MWVPCTWESKEDVLRDLATMAEYPQTEPESVRVPTTILQYRQQMEMNQQKPLNSDIDENVTMVVSGRGRGIHDRVIRPGGIIDCHPSDETELKKQIRQVAGLGYSNQLIEQSIQAHVYEPKYTTTNPSFKMVPVSQTSGSSSSSSQSPSKKKNSVQTKSVCTRAKNEDASALI